MLSGLLTSKPKHKLKTFQKQIHNKHKSEDVRAPLIKYDGLQTHHEYSK